MNIFVENTTKYLVRFHEAAMYCWFPSEGKDFDIIGFQIAHGPDFIEPRGRGLYKMSARAVRLQRLHELADKHNKPPLCNLHTTVLFNGEEFVRKDLIDEFSVRDLASFYKDK